MATAVDRDGIRNAYDDVRSDTSDTEWSVVSNLTMRRDASE